MKQLLRAALVMMTLAAAAQTSSAQVVFHQYEQFGGRSFTADRDVRNLKRFGFNDMASSAVVEAGRWEVCERVRFEGRCVVLRPGSYPSLATMSLGNQISSIRQIDPRAKIADNRYPPLPQSPVTFYEHSNFTGAAFATASDVDNFSRFGFNNSASSMIISDGAWELCNREGFRGRCVVLQAGQYASLNSIGLDDRVSSIRRVDSVAQRDEQTLRNPGVTFYERENFTGKSFATGRDVADLRSSGFNDRASSAVVVGAPWQVCDNTGFGGRCLVLPPGQYPTLQSMGMANRISSIRLGETTAQQQPAMSAPTITFFEGERFTGQAYKTEQPIVDFGRAGLAGRARSAEVMGAQWEVCPDPRFGGQCMLLRPGRYPTLASMGLPGRIASVRATAATDPVASPNQRFYEANVTSVKAVVDTPQERCWVDQEQARNQPNIPAAIAGAVIGGILGHQVGGGTGKDIATVGGVVAGAAVGARIGRGDSEEIKRCEQVPAQSRTQFWDVTYYFRGLEHRVQMSAPPGQTVRVNERGELID